MSRYNLFISYINHFFFAMHYSNCIEKDAELSVNNVCFLFKQFC